MQVLTEAHKSCKTYKTYENAQKAGEEICSKATESKVYLRFIIASTPDKRFFVVFVGQSAMEHNNYIVTAGHCIAG